MTNKVDGVNQGQVQAGQRAGNAKVDRVDSGAPAGKGDTKPSTRDTVQLTDSARALQELERVLADAPVVDSQRVESIRQAIAAGEYNVDPERIAEQIIQLEKDLGR